MAGVQTNRKWWTLGAVCVATFMLLLDITVVNTALPKIQQDLGGSFSDLQWVIDAYALSLAALVLTAGSLADRLGRRRVFVAGLAIFSIASLLCARWSPKSSPAVPSGAWRWASTAPRSASPSPSAR
jgi:MFS family permease